MPLPAGMLRAEAGHVDDLERGDHERRRDLGDEEAPTTCQSVSQLDIVCDLFRMRNGRFQALNGSGRLLRAEGRPRDCQTQSPPYGGGP